MAFLVQSENGGVDGANAYVSVEYFTTYHADRGNDHSAFDNDDIQVAIIKATDYLDKRFHFVGERARIEQRTAWPRIDAFDADDNYRHGIPHEVKDACSEYALRALSAPLVPDPTPDPSGQVVESKSEQVGPISESVSYAAGGAFQMPRYPDADRLLTVPGLVVSGRNLRRA